MKVKLQNRAGRVTSRILLGLICCSICLMWPEAVAQSNGKINPWAKFDLKSRPDKFQFGIVADRTGGHRDGVFADGLQKLSLLHPEFVMSVGDLIEGYTEDLAVIEQQWNELTGILATLDAPLFHVPGNHDISNKFMETEWTKRFGRPYYHFVYQDVLFLCLDTEDPPTSHIGDEQIDYITKTLAEHIKARWTLVFMHEPLWSKKSDTGWLRVEELLQDRPYTVFAGHEHRYLKEIRHNREYFWLGVTGAGSQLRGVDYFGEFDHVVWVTMTDEGPEIALLTLDGVRADDVCVPEDAKILALLQGERAHRIESVFIEEDESFYSGGTTSIHLTNDSDFPIKIKAELTAPSGLEATPGMIERVIAPKTTEIENVSLNVAKPINAFKVGSGSVAWSLDGAPIGRPPIHLEEKSRFWIEPMYSCLASAASPVVDGRLDDWPEVPLIGHEPVFVVVASDEWSGAEDLSFGLAAAYDNAKLYLAVQVFDDEIDTEKREYFQLFLDPRPPRERADMTSRKADPQWNVLTVRPNAHDVLSSEDGQSLPEGTKAAALLNDSGYTAEIALPISYLDQKQDGHWQDFRLNVLLWDWDYDNPGLSVKVVEWRPDWRNPLYDTSRFGVFKRK